MGCVIVAVSARPAQSEAARTPARPTHAVANAGFNAACTAVRPSLRRMVNATVLRGAGSQLGQFGEAISHYTDALEKLEASGERENCAARTQTRAVRLGHHLLLASFASRASVLLISAPTSLLGLIQRSSVRGGARRRNTSTTHMSTCTPRIYTHVRHRCRPQHCGCSRSPAHQHTQFGYRQTVAIFSRHGTRLTQLQHCAEGGTAAGRPW